MGGGREGGEECGRSDHRGSAPRRSGRGAGGSQHSGGAGGGLGTSHSVDFNGQGQASAVFAMCQPMAGSLFASIDQCCRTS